MIRFKVVIKCVKTYFPTTQVKTTTLVISAYNSMEATIKALGRTTSIPFSITVSFA
jgi:hypothetical protein